jgi:ABC-type nickel/cobalt efflux system permease component RcnA
VAAGAHFLSDVVAAAVIGWLAGWLVWRWRDPALDEHRAYADHGSDADHASDPDVGSVARSRPR